MASASTIGFPFHFPLLAGESVGSSNWWYTTNLLVVLLVDCVVVLVLENWRKKVKKLPPEDLFLVSTTVVEQGLVITRVEEAEEGMQNQHTIHQ